nr:hypothetical protein [Paenibacillus xylanexedens]
MKKKLLIGLLTVATCFSVGSTSFASDNSTTSQASFSPSPVIQPYQDFGAVINLNVGQRTWATGYSFQIITTDGSVIIEPYNDYAFYALRPGVTVIRADFGNGNWMYYSVVVK